MRTIEDRKEAEEKGFETLLRWLLIAMLAVVFGTQFLPGLIQQLSGMSITINSTFLINSAFAALLVITLFGLMVESVLAFLLLYASALMAILVMGVSLIPWAVELAPPELATETMIACNVMVIILGAFCHWLHKNRHAEDLS